MEAEEEMNKVDEDTLSTVLTTELFATVKTTLQQELDYTNNKNQYKNNTFQCLKAQQLQNKKLQSWYWIG